MMLFSQNLAKRLTLLIILMLAPLTWAKGVYMTAEQFLQENFTAKPEPQVIWLNSEIKEQLSKILYRPYRGLRVRYWRLDNRSAWIFDEIGKERPITIGLIVNQQQIESVKILAFRESRGGEVRYSFFTDQFQGIELKDDNKLNQHIDGITGATLSVNAVKRATKLALFLNNVVLDQQSQEKASSVPAQ